MHKHITTDDYPIIAGMLRVGHKQKDIAEIVGCTPSAISQEINRNKDRDGVYRAHSARKKAKKRRKESKKKYRKIDNDIGIQTYIEDKIEPLISPEVLAHELDIHHQTIYSWIYRERTDLLPQLPQRGRKRRRYGSKRGKKIGWTQKVKTIHKKPNTKILWEGDTIKGKTKARVLTHVEYTSLLLKADLLPDGKADSVQSTLKRKPIKDNIVYDRGSEFALWKMIEKDCGIEVFFADPHHPWQRGKNENTNGRLRRVFPKKFNFDTITQKQLDKVVYKMNHTPRKSLDWRTPAEVYESLVSD